MIWHYQKKVVDIRFILPCKRKNIQEILDSTYGNSTDWIKHKKKERVTNEDGTTSEETYQLQSEAKGNNRS